MGNIDDAFDDLRDQVLKRITGLVESVDTKTRQVVALERQVQYLQLELSAQRRHGNEAIDWNAKCHEILNLANIKTSHVTLVERIQALVDELDANINRIHVLEAENREQKSVANARAETLYKIQQVMGIGQDVPDMARDL